ncbi:MAG: hypothetical protein IH588_19795 [Anaerolineales bacterium]|nr:hypothetical protein [Anaerolineales bacterium]
MKIKIFFLTAVISISLACSTITTAPPPQVKLDTLQLIGFDYSKQIPAHPEGDITAATHLFVHKYPIPNDGVVMGVTYLNDSDTETENITILILRPIGGGWKVIHRAELLGDDLPPVITGTTTFSFETSLTVKKGDMFAHWQPDETGPIPLNLESSPFDGLSFNKAGFSADDIREGEIISSENFSGGRDYFINLIFEEPYD